MRRKVLFRYLMIVSVLALIGCRKSATSPDSNASTGGNASATTSDGNPTAVEGPGGQSSQASAPAQPLAPPPIVVDAGTEFVVTADQSVSSKTSNPGDRFDATIAEPVVVGDRVVIPRGARATGIVTEAKDAGRFKGNASISVTLGTVMVNGTEYEVRTSEVTEASKGRGKRTAEGAGGGAIVGALIGALAGGGRGAAIGAGVGAGAGTAGTAMTGERDITIGAETRLHFRLRDPLEVREN